MSYYLLVPRLEVSSANFMNAWWLLAPPGPLAALGFAHALGRQLGLRERGVAIVHHDAQLLAEQLKPYDVLRPHQHRAAGYLAGSDHKKDYAEGSNTLALQPVAKGHLGVSLVIAFDEDGPLSLGQVENFLAGGRYAGGVIWAHGKLEAFTSLSECQARLKTGFFVEERTDLMEATMAELACDPLDAMLQLTSSRQRETYPWLIPSVLGYSAITPILEDVPGSRENALHAYAEPLVGLTQFAPVRDNAIPFWRYERRDNHFYAKTY